MPLYDVHNVSNDVVDEVMAKCASQVQAYNQCISENPHEWDQSCMDKRAAVTECAEEKVSVLKKVKNDCASEISAFNRCLQEHSLELHKCLATKQQVRPNFIKNLNYELYNCTAKSTGSLTPSPL